MQCNKDSDFKIPPLSVNSHDKIFRLQVIMPEPADANVPVRSSKRARTAPSRAEGESPRKKKPSKTSKQTAPKRSRSGNDSRRMGAIETVTLPATPLGKRSKKKAQAARSAEGDAPALPQVEDAAVHDHEQPGGARRLRSLQLHS